MLSPEERYRLLEEASELSGRWEYAQVLHLLTHIQNADLLAEPELAYLAALAYYRGGNRERSRAILRQIRSMSVRHERDRLYCRRKSLEGAIYVEQGRLGEARHQFLEILFVGSVRGYLPQVTGAIMNLGVIESIKCNWDEAVAAFERAIAAYENLGELYNLAGAHHDLAMTYRELGCLDAAATHCEKSWQIFQDSHSPKDVVYTQYERSLLLLTAGDLAFAESTVLRAMDLLDGDVAQEEGEGLRVLGMVQKAKGNLEEAEVCLTRATVLAEKANATLLLAGSHEELAILYQMARRYSDAQRHISSAVGLYKRMGAEKRADRALQRSGASRRR